MKYYDTIEEGESTPLQNGGGYSSVDRTTAAATPRMKHKRTSAGILHRAVMVGTTVAVGALLLLMAGPSMMTTMNTLSSNIDGVVVVSSATRSNVDSTDCAPATGTFSGLSCKNSHGYCAGPGGSFGEGVHMHQYETCYVSNNSPPNDRCWSRSHISTVYDSEGFDVTSYLRCDPVGYNDGDTGYDEDGIWHVSAPKSDGSCGNPCREFTTDVRSNRCIPAGGTFNGNSYITLDGTVDHFETCYKYGSYDKYCWTKSYLDTSGFGGDDLFKQCVPDPKGGQWRAIHQRDMKYVNPVTHPYSCGDPCHGQHEK